MRPRRGETRRQRVVSRSTSSEALSRRIFLQKFTFAILGSLLLQRNLSASVATAGSAGDIALVEVVRTYESLEDLQRLVEQFQDTRGLRQTVRIIIKQSNLAQNIKLAASSRLEAGSVRDKALREGAEAVEYLSQIIAYYNPVSKTPTPEMRAFANESVKAAQRHLRAYLDAFPPDEVERARRTAFVQDVAAYESM
ncbi:hypothetical protein F1559_001349 [Cyanidiococcus yangmingshanensis]|uniref:Uncharacterized protein n=1 Tax=Cyanidiococcus yangmingshanensis TaxID=2690220 RepID=A0A7J7IDD2_9RHOD|nr:hypothetical protein F1559_001349 [Cyanidiococcus yangmingshanensis]